MATVGVIGSGAWATVSGMLLAKAGHVVKQWVHRVEYADAINHAHCNHLTLPDTPLPSAISATLWPQDLADVAAWVIAVPSHYLSALSSFPYQQQPVVSLVKGVSSSSSHPLPIHEMATWWGRVPAVLSGPNLASELAKGMPGAAVVASSDPKQAVFFQGLFSSEQFRVYTSHDEVGVSYGGILKNVYAVAAGIVDGLGLGMNAKAALMTRALHEMSRLGEHWGGHALTFYGLSGVGDLMATAYSPASRNWQSGYLIGQDRHDQLPCRGVAEGIRTIQTMYPPSDGSTPIYDALRAIVCQQQPVKDVVAHVMRRALKAERS